MKRSLIFIILALYCTSVNAQNKDINLSELKAPSSPAFTILGVQPNEISRPKSFRALETEFLSNFVGKNGSLGLPNSYAIEITPFWLLSHPNMTINDYAGPTPMQGISRSFSLSTSINEESLSDSLTLSNLGFGGRFTLDFRSIDQEKFKEAYDGLDIVQAAISTLNLFLNDVVLENADNFDTKDIARDFITKESKSAIRSLSSPKSAEYFNYGLTEFLSKLSELSDSEVKSKLGDVGYIDKVFDEIDDELRTVAVIEEKAGELSDAIHTKHGLSVEVAFATKYSLSNNEELSKSDFKKYGIWITPSYKNKNLNFLEFLGVLRYVQNDTKDIPELDLNNLKNLTAKNFSENLDVGFRLVLTSPDKMDRVPFSLSYEWLMRKQWIDLKEETVGNTTLEQTVKQNDYRFSFSFEYRISDRLNFTYSIGKAFNKNTTQSKSVFSLVGLNLGLGGKKASDFSSFK